MCKKIQILFISIFLVLLLIPICFIRTGNNIVSSIDNRELTEFPDFTEKNWKNELELYLSDRIGGRSLFINLNTVFNDKVFGKMVHPTYTYGTDGYVFFRIHRNVEYGEFHHQFALMVKKIQDYCEERGIRFYLLFDPEKISVYSRYLPKGVYYNDDWVQQFFAELDSLGVVYVDNSQLLREKSYSEQVFNKKYDAGHWNDLGMFYGLNNLFNKMSKDFPNVRELTFDDFDISYQNMNTLPVSHFAINEDVPVFKKKIEVENLTKLFANEIPLDSNFHSFTYLRNKAENSSDLPRILLFQGSYLNRNFEYIINNASESITVHNYQNVLDADYYINVFNPDCVVFDVAEYVFSNTYFDLEKMRNLYFPISYNTFKRTVTSNEFVPLQEESLIVVKKEGESLTTFFLEKKIPDVKNAYFFCNFNVYDFQNSNGALYFSIMNFDDPFDSGEVLLETFDGSCKRFPIIIRDADAACEDTYNISTGISFPAKKEMLLGEPVYKTDAAELSNDTYSFQTNYDGNIFNSLVIQLHNPRDDTYKALCAGVTENTLLRKAYHHNTETGEYVLNIRANSNKADEWVSYNITFEQNKDYYFEFIIDSLTANSLVTHNFHIYEAGNTVSMKTDVKRNVFDKVCVQLFDPYKNEYYSIDSSKTNLCGKMYSHKRETGDYIINLKSNSNKKDEMLSYTVHLEEGNNYLYDLVIKSFNRKEVVVEEFNLYK